ncbi:endonuclease/exonuclease/phosphatase family protein [Kitasatospora sp. NPDC051984]|uniref:endonuclease/exonuclease/phosphatase family protein n=1 Tax=Kitasatospora sp. NPDC051984 TaxID=3364059 RepID=UPI0037CAA172
METRPPETIRLATYNAYKLGTGEFGTPRWQARVDAIREIGPDVLCLQEVLVPSARRQHESAADAAERRDREASAVIARFAADCGLSAAISDGTADTAMAPGVGHLWYTAILWDPTTVQPVPGTFRAFGAPDFHHGLTTLQFDVGAAEALLVLSYHGDPFRPDQRANEAIRIKGFLRCTGGARPAVEAGDFNGLSAAQVIGPDGRTAYYDGEPYADQTHDDLEYQCVPETIGTTNRADRRQSEVLLRGGFAVDAAAHLGAPWKPVSGHWPDGTGDPSPWGERRIDLILATRPVARALISYSVHATEASTAASDHLPVYVDLRPADIRTDKEAPCESS